MGLERLPKTIELSPDGSVSRLVDQTKLPRDLVFIDVTTWEMMVDCIKKLAVRGAPALGVAGADALALYSVNQDQSSEKSSYLKSLEVVAQQVATARPTAVNLSWGVNRVLHAARLAQGSVADIKRAVICEAHEIAAEDEAACRDIGRFGAQLLPQHARILTHCNAGSLATSFYGTALGVIYAGFEAGKIEHVYADETRPVGQGSRLTVWELSQAGIPTTLLCDNMAASLMAQGAIDAVIVGADRICANGDVANKIGTYSVAVLAQYHHVPVYVAAPHSTIDMSLARGEDIEIEHRNPQEVSTCVPEGVAVYNPAFDVTPAHLIRSIITNRGVFSPSELGAHFRSEKLF